MGGGDSVDREFLAGGFGEMEEAADVIVLVVTGEEAFGFGGGQLKGGESNGLTKAPGKQAVAIDKLPERHHWWAALGFSRHRNRIESYVMSAPSVHPKEHRGTSTRGTSEAHWILTNR